MWPGKNRKGQEQYVLVPNSFYLDILKGDLDGFASFPSFDISDQGAFSTTKRFWFQGLFFALCF